MNKSNFIGVSILTLAINVFLDRLTKILAFDFLRGESPIGFFYNTFVLVYTENSGAFLGLGSNWYAPLKYVIFVIIPLAVCIVFFLHCCVREKNRLRAILIVTVVAGGVSNLVDRLFNGFSVIDFMNFGIGNVRTGILNVADLSVTFGAIALILLEYRKQKH